MFEQVEVNSEKWLDKQNLKNEVWKDITDYKKLYQVSNYGRVKSLEKKILNKTYREKILKLEKSKDGYLRVDLYINNKRKHKKVHRLVAKEFLENYNDNYCINHKDENRYNNAINNLELCDYLYNINYGNRNKKVANKLSKKINQYDLQGNFIRTWDSMIEIQRQLGILVSSVYSCCKGKISKTKGYVFKYYNDFTNF